jgi:predicted phosphodiesterase
MNDGFVAVLSDIHGNLEALEATLKEIEAAEQRTGTHAQIICIGDIFGYGPDQLECYRIARERFDVILPGNHEANLWLKLKHPEAKIPGASLSAMQSIEYTVEQLLGKQEIKGSRTGQMIKIPNESLETFQKSEYLQIVAREIAGKYAPEININSPETSLFKKSIPKEQLDQIGINYVAAVLTQHAQIIDEYDSRLERRNKVLELFSFIENIAKKENRMFALKNAIFVHDNPVKPGNAEYLVDEALAKKYVIHNQVDLRNIRKDKFPGVEYIFVGHSHVLPATVEINGIKVVYAGSVGIPRLDNVERHACYTAIMIQNDRVIQVKPRQLQYDYTKTKKKMIERGLPDKFE